MSKVLIPLAEGCEELEAVTLIDILRRADIDVSTASLTEGREVCCSRQTRLVADVTLDAVADQSFDMIILPGGLPGADYLDQDARVRDILVRHRKNNKLIGAICAAPKVLVNAGVADNLKLSAYPTVLDEHQTSVQISNKAVEEDDGVITSRGPGTALDFALAIVEKLKGQDKRNEIETALVR